MITKGHIPARRSMIGQYGFQYPNREVAGIVIPPESNLEPLSWTVPEGWKAFLWHQENGKSVVWVHDKNVEP